MALKGTLKDFSVADIFQLIGQQQKSGSLHVRTGEKEAHIVFDQGKVVLGTFRRSNEEFLLGTMLLRAGAITSEQLSAAVEAQKVTRRSLGDILKSNGAISGATLGQFVYLQLKEVLFRVFQWKEGLYEFVAEKIQYNKAILKPQSAEGVLMDGFRMLDEWPRVQAKIVSMDTVFRSNVDPAQLPEASSANADAEIDLEIGESAGPASSGTNYSSDEITLLRLIDGTRSLQQIIYMSRLGTFDTCSTMAGLLDRGVVEKKDVLGQTKADVAVAPSAPTWGGWVRNSVFPLTFFLLLSTGVTFLTVRARAPRGDRPLDLSLGRIRNGALRGQIEKRIEIFRLDRGRYPQNLDEVLDEESAARWDYTLTDDGYTLTRKVPGR